MLTFSMRKLFQNKFGSWQSATPRRKPRTKFRPRLEVLEDRFCPATTDLWIATGTTAQSWDVGTNWSQGVSPSATMTAVFDPNQTNNGHQGGNAPCYIQPGDNLPTLPGLTINDWSGTLTLQSNLAAKAVTINPRTTNAGKSEIIINYGSNLYASQSLTWAGGNVSGSGYFEVGGSDTINGTSATDKPTLGTRMDVGTTYLGTYYAGTMNFSATSQPLVVVQNADIDINNKSTLAFNNQAASGQTSATAISNGDTSSHSIVVNTGGALGRTNSRELYVAIGLDVEGGYVLVSNPVGVTSGNPLHFTRPLFSGGPGMLVNTGSVVISGDLTSDYYGNFQAGTVNVYSNATLTLGVNANSTASSEEGATFLLSGTLVAHGGFTIYSGTLGTDGSARSLIKVDKGNSFSLIGGELAITPPGATTGNLEIQGNFVADGGTIVDNVNSGDGTFGVLKVDGNATLYTNTTFSSLDLNNPGANFTKNWNLMTVGGTVTGDFSYNLPTLKWKHSWNGGTLTIQENT